VRRVEAGEVIDVTVSGRLAARMIPAQPKQWLNWSEVAECCVGRADPGWEQDRGELAISAVALAELHFGVLVTVDPAVSAERLRRLVEFQRRFTALRSTNPSLRVMARLPQQL
jgi:antitoxin (DNA-binding transcriptional repressor) of toxin-antitoxin stability system